MKKKYEYFKEGEGQPCKLIMREIDDEDKITLKTLRGIYAGEDEHYYHVYLSKDAKFPIGFPKLLTKNIQVFHVNYPSEYPYLEITGCRNIRNIEVKKNERRRENSKRKE